MARGKYQKRKKSILPLALLLAAVVTLGSGTGGVVAYLFTSSQEVTTSFTVAADPTVTVNGTMITVSNPECDVYLRVAVAANRTNGSNLVANTSVPFGEAPVGWTKYGDYYYYNSRITKNAQAQAVSFGVNPGDGVQLVIAAQVIQAVGTTDSGNTDAVINAWSYKPLAS